MMRVRNSEFPKIEFWLVEHTAPGSPLNPNASGVVRTVCSESSDECFDSRLPIGVGG